MESSPSSGPRTVAAIVLILVIGAVLRSVQYGAVASLSSDEVAPALNVVDRGLGELLFLLLAHFQIAPLGFLAIRLKRRDRAAQGERP